MLCKKCNRKLDINDRCCLYCGEVNPYNKKNIELETQKEVEMIKNELEKEAENNKKIKQKQEIIAKDIKYNKMLFIFVNIMFFSLLCYFLYKISHNIILSIVITFVFLFYHLCLEKIFMKANIKWYIALFPLFNIYFYFLITDDDTYITARIFEYYMLVNSYIIITTFLGIFMSQDPIKLIILMSVLFFITNITFFKYFHYKLGIVFGYNKYISMLFPLVAIPIIAFSKKYQY